MSHVYNKPENCVSQDTVAFDHVLNFFSVDELQGLFLEFVAKDGLPQVLDEGGGVRIVEAQKNAWVYYKLVRDLEKTLQNTVFFDDCLVFHGQHRVDHRAKSGRRPQFAIQVKSQAMKEIGLDVFWDGYTHYPYTPHNLNTVGLVWDDNFFQHAKAHSTIISSVFEDLHHQQKAICDFVAHLDRGQGALGFLGSDGQLRDLTIQHGKILQRADEPFLINQNEFLGFLEKKALLRFVGKRKEDGAGLVRKM